MDLTTPALLFSAISLLLLAYTNRFLVLAQLIRQLHGQAQAEIQDMVLRQIANLRQRVVLIKVMQGLGVLSFILCSLSMLFIFIKLDGLARISFGLSLFLLVLSLLFSLYEILISTKAIEIELEDLAKRSNKIQPDTETIIQNQDFDLSQKPACPHCSSTDVAKIVYGKPALTRQILQGMETGEIISGGCMIHNGAPQWHCHSCNQQFGQLQFDPEPVGAQP